jgi:hypothetical protein
MKKIASFTILLLFISTCVFAESLSMGTSIHMCNRRALSTSSTISNGDIDDEDMADITDWTDGDNGTGDSSQVTFDNKSCIKLDTGAAGYAIRYQDVGSFGLRTVFSINLYFDTIGTQNNNDYFLCNTNNGTMTFSAQFCSDGLFIQGPLGSHVEVGTDLVVQDVWQEWTFDINWVSKTVDIYLDNVLQVSGISSGYEDIGIEGKVFLQQWGSNTANLISYVDWFKAGSDFK